MAFIDYVGWGLRAPLGPNPKVKFFCGSRLKIPNNFWIHTYRAAEREHGKGKTGMNRVSRIFWPLELADDRIRSCVSSEAEECGYLVGWNYSGLVCCVSTIVSSALVEVIICRHRPPHFSPLVTQYDVCDLCHVREHQNGLAYFVSFVIS